MSVRQLIWVWQILEFAILYLLVGRAGSSVLLILFIVLLLMLSLRFIIIGIVAGAVSLYWGVTKLSLKGFISLWFGEFWAFVVMYSGFQAVPKSLLVFPSEIKNRHVVLVHGFFCNNGFWYLLARRLIKHGFSVSFVEMSNPFASLERLSGLIEREVMRIKSHNSATQTSLVTFSMGGLAARFYLSHTGKAENIRFISVNMPFNGTYLGGLPGLLGAKNGQEMRPNNPWIKKLALAESPEEKKFHVGIWSAHDTIVIPSELGRPAFHPLMRKAKGHLNASIDRSLHRHICRLLSL